MVGRPKEQSANTSGVEPVSFLIRLVPVIGEGDLITEIESDYGDAVLLEVPGHPYALFLLQLPDKQEKSQMHSSLEM